MGQKRLLLRSCLKYILMLCTLCPCNPHHWGEQNTSHPHPPCNSPWAFICRPCDTLILYNTWNENKKYLSPILTHFIKTIWFEATVYFYLVMNTKIDYHANIYSLALSQVENIKETSQISCLRTLNIERRWWKTCSRCWDQASCTDNHRVGMIIWTSMTSSGASSYTNIQTLHSY